MRKRLVRNTYSYWTLLLIALALSETGQSAPTTLDSLPRDVIYNVQEYLDLDDYKAMRSVSRSLHERLGLFEHIPNIIIKINRNNKNKIFNNISHIFSGHILMSPNVADELNMIRCHALPEAKIIINNDESHKKLKTISVNRTCQLLWKDFEKDTGDFSLEKIENLKMLEIQSHSFKKIKTLLKNISFNGIKNFASTVPLHDYRCGDWYEFFKKKELHNIENFCIQYSGQDVQRIVDILLPIDKIQKITLSGNYLNDEIADKLQKFVHLHYLDLSSNFLTENSFYILCNETLLNTLLLSNNRITILNKTKIKQNYNIEALALSQNNIDLLGIENIFTDNFSQIKQIKLCEMGKYPFYIKLNERITEADLSNNKVLSIDEIFSHPLLSILVLNLSKNSLHGECDRIAECIPHIKNLRLSGCLLDGNDIQSLSPITKSLYFLDLSNNMISEDGISKYIQRIQTNPNFCLDISSNNCLSSKVEDIFWQHRSKFKKVFYDTQNTKKVDIFNLRKNIFKKEDLTCAIY